MCTCIEMHHVIGDGRKLRSTSRKTRSTQRKWSQRMRWRTMPTTCATPSGMGHIPWCSNFFFVSELGVMINTHMYCRSFVTMSCLLYFFPVQYLPLISK